MRTGFLVVTVIGLLLAGGGARAQAQSGTVHDNTPDVVTCSRVYLPTGAGSLPALEICHVFWRPMPAPGPKSVPKLSASRTGAMRLAQFYPPFPNNPCAGLPPDCAPPIHLPPAPPVRPLRVKRTPERQHHARYCQSVDATSRKSSLSHRTKPVCARSKKSAVRHSRPAE